MTTAMLNKSESRQKPKTLGSARYVYPCIGENEIQQKHAVLLLDDLATVSGEILPPGTKATILSGGSYNGRMSACLSVWGSGRQVNVYTESD